MFGAVLAAACLATLLPGGAAAAPDDDGGPPPLPCSLYLAPSSAVGPGAGWGVYAGVDFAPGDLLGETGPGVPLVDPVSVSLGAAGDA
eukprot:CAMPEP_0194334094 /NCGR_PEP_ID=MMETSP0171-20130528/64976_1 /TAXON_ID=218684 /ORGANISM="Corethron pennatum, Strain L29A3" /LENGTH=87 /DNA_ID=CAMNT_0039096613 /DNA_START=93 /DNA_END=353 /DNA_ORIENTATION=-